MSREVFTQIYQRNYWKGSESRSGQGSSLEATEAIRRMLPSAIEAYSIKSVLDIPCGDFAWWPEMRLKGLSYIGADIVPEIVSANQERYPDMDFRVLDLANSELPKADLVFCRDCLGHLSNRNVWLALKNIKRSGAKWLMATTFYDPKWSTSADINDGEWRPINLIKQFGLGSPTLLISENFRANMDFHDKSLGLWRVDGEPW